MKILEAKKIHKNFLRKEALVDLSLEIDEGKIVGIMGPNGSGKTTFLKIITGMIRPSSGTVRVCGAEIVSATKGFVSYLPDCDFLYPWMNIKDAKEVYATFFKDFNARRFDELLEFMKLTPDMGVKSLSKGMQEKMALSLTLARDAKLTILDEPLNGVDPIAREQILGAIIKGFRFESSMLITSHLINEVESILDEVHFLKEGRLALSGNAEELRSEYKLTLDGIYREVFAC